MPTLPEKLLDDLQQERPHEQTQQVEAIQVQVMRRKLLPQLPADLACPQDPWSIDGGQDQRF